MIKISFWILAKLVFLLLISIVAPRIISYGGVFSHPNIIRSYHLPQFIFSFANFDGVHYINIAREGYHQFDQAFFPLYPILIKAFSPFFAGNHLLAGLVISNLSFILGLGLMNKLVFENVSKRSANFTVYALVFFPTAFFFQTEYTEGLFFLCTIASFWAFFKKKYIWSGIFSYFAALTRFAGVFLLIAFLISLLMKKKKVIKDMIFVLIGPIFGLSTYMIYLWRTFGDPLLFFSSQSSFGAGRSTSFVLLPQVLYRYLKIFLTVDKGLVYYRAVLEFSIFILVFTGCSFYLYNAWKKKNEFGLVIGTFSLLNIIIPTLTGTFLSIPRFALLSLAFFIGLNSVLNRNQIILVFVTSSILQIILFVYFIQGHFIS